MYTVDSNVIPMMWVLALIIGVKINGCYHFLKSSLLCGVLLQCDIVHVNIYNLTLIPLPVLPGLWIDPYFTDFSGLSWTTDGYQQHQPFCGSNVLWSLYAIIITHVIVGSQCPWWHSENSYKAVSWQKYVCWTTRVWVVTVRRYLVRDYCIVTNVPKRRIH